MHNLKNLKHEEYIGVIRKGVDKQDLSGMYLVYIRELMVQTTSLKPIWVKNEILGNRFSRFRDFETNKIISMGSYFPLREGMLVNVKFRGDTLESGYISNVVSYLPLIDSPRARDTFHLLNKTPGDSWIYQDDSRNLTHIMHQNGKSNIILDDDSITLQTGGETHTNGFEVSKTGTRMEFKNSSIIMDDTGISFKIGDTQFVLTESGISMNASKFIDIESQKKLRIKSYNMKLSSVNELSLYSDVVRITGATQTAVTGSTVNISSLKLTNITSNLQTKIESDIKLSIASSMLNMSVLTNAHFDIPVVLWNSNLFGIKTSSLNLSSSVINMDGVLLHNINIATGINKGVNATNIVLDKGTDAAALSVSLLTSTNSAVTKIFNTTLITAVPGSASPVGNINVPVVNRKKVGMSTREKIIYLNTSNLNYNQIVKEQFEDLRGTHDIRV